MTPEEWTEMDRARWEQAAEMLRLQDAALAMMKRSTAALERIADSLDAIAGSYCHGNP